MSSFDPTSVNLDTARLKDVLCYFAVSKNEYNGHMGARISSIFVILAFPSAFTIFPVVSRRIPSWKIPLSVYIFARYFGTGVIVATAFIHLLDPAYEQIGPNTCVGQTGYWAEYPWCAGIVLLSVVFMFLMDLGAETYVETNYGIHRNEDATDAFIQHEDPTETQPLLADTSKNNIPSPSLVADPVDPWDPETDGEMAEKSFQKQIAAFLLLEFGIIFHSVIIGMNLGVSGAEFATLYPVLVFHQSFEGLGIGARMSTIPFGERTWLPWILCAAYGLTTPIAIAIGLIMRTTYSPGSKMALTVQGVLNAISAGILIYSGLVELLAKDFLFDPNRSKRRSRLLLMVGCTLLGAGVMALIGKWA